MIDEIKDKEVMVMGLARSGVAAARLLAELGAAKVTAVDKKLAQDLAEELEQLKKYPQIKVVTGDTGQELLHTGISIIIKSPGVPPSLEIFHRAKEMQIPVLSEIELAYAFIKAPFIGITGTNGKTTTTALTAEIMKEARFNEVKAAGNIGLPLCEVVGKVTSSGVIAVELSSFQLNNIRDFRPTVGVFLNFEEDHLDYHSTLKSYFQAKARIFENQKESDYAVLNAGDERVAALAPEVKGNVLWFGKGPVPAGAGIEDGQIYLYNERGRGPVVCPTAEIALPGEHNLENALAATAAAWAAGADAAAIGRTLKRFQGIEHRLEFVTSINGVDFINDSKGTNPGAAIKALNSFPGKQKILIAGGLDKGSDFNSLLRVIKEEVKHLVLLGETKEKLGRAAEETGYTSYEKVGNLEEAVTAAWQKAEPGDIVLLSPACASWDMFKDFEVRGRLFKELVRQLTLKGAPK